MADTQILAGKTLEDFMKLPGETRAEFIDGEILMLPSPKAWHQRCVQNLIVHLRAFVESRGLGQVFVAPLDVHLPSKSVVQPDVFFVASRNLSIVQDWVRGVPDLLIEVLSPDGADRDRVKKRELYERNGVPEYWIVDWAAGTVEVLALSGGRYAVHGSFKKGDDALSAVLPDLRLPVRLILA